MSKNFLANVPINYIGTPYGQSIGACTPPSKEPTVVAMAIKWADYGASISKPQISVALNLIAQGSVTPALDKIRSVKIDNSYCAVPVSVQFPDTLDTVICPPYSIVISPVATQVQQAIVYGDGFYTGRTPQTTIEFFNVNLPPLFIPAELTDTVDLRYINNATAGGATTLNFSAITTTIPASPSRLIAYAIEGIGNAAGNRSIVSATIGGVAATIAIQRNVTATGAPSNVLVGIVYALVPTGNSVTLSMTFNATMTFVAVQAFGVLNYTQFAPADTDSFAQTAPSFGMTQFDAIPGAGILFSSILFGVTSDKPNWIKAEPVVDNLVLSSNFIYSAAIAESTENNAYADGRTTHCIVGAMWI